MNTLKLFNHRLLLFVLAAVVVVALAAYPLLTAQIAHPVAADSQPVAGPVLGGGGSGGGSGGCC